MKDLIIIGAGGFGREVAWLVERINRVSPTWRLLGFLDDTPELQGKALHGYPVLGKTEALPLYNTAYFVCAIGSSRARKSVIDRLSPLSPRFATLIDPSVILSDRVEIGEGSLICAGSVLTVDISIGRHCVVSVGSTLGHDAVLRDFVTLYPAVNISGKTLIGLGAELGTGTQMIQGKTIGQGSIVGAGSVIIRDIPENCTAVGVPAKPIKTHPVPFESFDH